MASNSEKMEAPRAPRGALQLVSPPPHADSKPRRVPVVAGRAPRDSAKSLADKLSTMCKVTARERMHGRLQVTASSAAAERVFSALNNTFGKQQTSALEDYIETSVLLQYRVRSERQNPIVVD